MDNEVKVRIALAIDHNGSWCASGYSGDNETRLFDYILDTLEPGEARYYIDAVVRKPEKATPVEGTATKLKED